MGKWQPTVGCILARSHFRLGFIGAHMYTSIYRSHHNLEIWMMVMSTGSACDLNLFRFLLELLGRYVHAPALVPPNKIYGGVIELDPT